MSRKSTFASRRRHTGPTRLSPREEERREVSVQEKGVSSKPPPAVYQSSHQRVASQPSHQQSVMPAIASNRPSLTVAPNSRLANHGEPISQPSHRTAHQPTIASKRYKPTTASTNRHVNNRIGHSISQQSHRTADQ